MKTGCSGREGGVKEFILSLAVLIVLGVCGFVVRVLDYHAERM